jgi:hypothetical protein
MVKFFRYLSIYEEGARVNFSNYKKGMVKGMAEIMDEGQFNSACEEMRDKQLNMHLAESKNHVCFECDGKGEVERIVYNADFDDYEEITYPCPVCGDGE